MNIPRLGGSDLSKFAKEYNTLVSKNVKNPAEMRRSAVDSFERSDADGAAFFKGGYENYRKSVSYDVSYGYDLSEEAALLNERGGSISWQAKSENLAKAYAALYDEIVQGYENGTRQIDVTDENSESGYRTLTLEEELNALDAAYEKALKGFEELAAQQQKAKPIIEEWQKQVAKLRGTENSAETAEKQEAQVGQEEQIEQDEPVEQEEKLEQDEQNEASADQSGMSGSVSINAGKLARMLAAAKTRSQVRAVISKIQSDLKECENGKNQGMDVDESSVRAAERLLQEAKSKMASAENREPTPQEEMAAALASLM